jgi:hypothetical protein
MTDADITTTCATCGCKKLRSDFYVRGDGKRWDPTCKACRRDERRSRYKTRAGTSSLLARPIVFDPAPDSVPVARSEPAVARITEPGSASLKLDCADFGNVVALFSMLKSWRDEAAVEARLAGTTENGTLSNRN